MKMRRLSLYGSLVVVAALVAAVFAGFGGSPEARPVLAGPAVKVMVGGGHGTAAHIGNGYFITAAHVTKKATTVTLKADDGTRFAAVVLWSNKAYDVALVRAAPRAAAKVETLELSCRVPDIGEPIVALGSPMEIEFLRTWGHVSGKMREVGHWGEAILVDASLGPGMSGGPLLDAQGKLVGINVGVAVAALGWTPSLMGVSVSVPGTTVCGLLARP